MSKLIKSCFNCHYLVWWDHPGNRETPSDSGWDCNHNDAGDFEFFGQEPAGMPEEQIATYYGQRCSHWQEAKVARDLATFPVVEVAAEYAED